MGDRSSDLFPNPEQIHVAQAGHAFPAIDAYTVSMTIMDIFLILTCSRLQNGLQLIKLKRKGIISGQSEQNILLS